MLRFKFWLTVLLAAGLFVTSAGAAEQTTEPQPPSGSGPNWLSTVLHAAVPRTYENRKHWDKTKNVVVGVRGRLFKPRFRRKEMRHGTWRRSEVRLVEPEKRLKLALGEVKRTGAARHEFQLSVSARVLIILQQQEWRRDVRIYSVSGEAVADLEMDLRCEMTIIVTPAALLPSVAIEPVVKDADIRLKSFRLLSLGDARGSVVRKTGDLFEGLVRDELKEKEASIVKKINRSIAKRKDRLKLSVADLASGVLTKHFDLSKLTGAGQKNGDGAASGE